MVYFSEGSASIGGKFAITGHFSGHDGQKEATGTGDYCNKLPRIKPMVGRHIERCSMRFEAGTVYYIPTIRGNTMAKRIILALVVVSLAAGGAFAQVSLSAGLGGTFTADFFNIAWTKDGKDMLDATGYPKDANNVNIIGGGFFAYFDATYVMASLGMNFYDYSPANKDMKKAQDDMKIKQSVTEFNIGLYGKFPIDLGGLTLFPMLGADIKLVLDQTTSFDGEKFKYTNDEGEETSPLGDLSSVWFKAGIGLDIPLSDTMYLRPIFLYGIGLNNKVQKDMNDSLNEGTKMGSTVNHGLDVKLALGFKF